MVFDNVSCPPNPETSTQSENSDNGRVSSVSGSSSLSTDTLEYTASNTTTTALSSQFENASVGKGESFGSLQQLSTPFLFEELSTVSTDPSTSFYTSLSATQSSASVPRDLVRFQQERAAIAFENHPCSSGSQNLSTLQNNAKPQQPHQFVNYQNWDMDVEMKSGLESNDSEVKQPTSTTIIDTHLLTNVLQNRPTMSQIPANGKGGTIRRQFLLRPIKTYSKLEKVSTGLIPVLPAVAVEAKTLQLDPNSLTILKIPKRPSVSSSSRKKRSIVERIVTEDAEHCQNPVFSALKPPESLTLSQSSSESSSMEATKEKSNTNANGIAAKALEFVKCEKPRKWFPNQEERRELYSIGSFVIHSDAAGKPGEEVCLWKIRQLDGVVLEKFCSRNLVGRIYHVTDLKIVKLSGTQELYSNYVPIFYKIMPCEVEKVQIVQYFQMDKLYQHLLFIKKFEDEFIINFRLAVEMVARHVCTVGDNYISLLIDPNSKHYDARSAQAWRSTEDLLKRITRSLKSLCGFDQEVVDPILTYPRSKFSKRKKTEDPVNCTSCYPLSRSASFRAEVYGKPYNQLSFEQISSEPDNPKVLYFCYSCLPIIKIFHKTAHYLQSVYTCVRWNVAKFVTECDPDEVLDAESVIDTMIADGNWVYTSFLEFASLISDGEKEIERLKASKRRRGILPHSMFTPAIN